MTCTSCGHTNPERAKFCLECGAPIAARCTRVGARGSASLRSRLHDSRYFRGRNEGDMLIDVITPEEM